MPGVIMMFLLRVFMADGAIMMVSWCVCTIIDDCVATPERRKMGWRDRDVCSSSSPAAGGVRSS